MNTITKEDAQRAIENGYLMSIKRHLFNIRKYWGNERAEQSAEMLKANGYDINHDFMILRGGENGTELAPVKVI